MRYQSYEQFNMVLGGHVIGSPEYEAGKKVWEHLIAPLKKLEEDTRIQIGVGDGMFVTGEWIAIKTCQWKLIHGEKLRIALASLRNSEKDYMAHSENKNVRLKEFYSNRVAECAKEADRVLDLPMPTFPEVP